MKKQMGFTMIELLVVMAILGALMTMGVSTYLQSMKRGRDGKRVSDMQEVQKGFESFYAKSVDSSYGASCAAMFLDTVIFPKGAPTAPAGGLAYVAGTCNTSTYCYCAALELPADYGNSTDANCTFAAQSAATGYYCVKNVQ